MTRSASFGRLSARAALTAARVLVATALALLAAGALLMFLVGAAGPEDSETTYVHVEAVLPALACVVVSSCVAIWGLARTAPRTVLAGAGGVAVGATILMGAAEDVGGGQIEYWRALFVLVLGLAAAAVVVGRR